MRSQDSPLKISKRIREPWCTHCGFLSETACCLSLAYHTIHIPWKGERAILMLPEPSPVVPGSLEGWNPALKASMLLFWLGNLCHSSEILEFIERWFMIIRGAYAVKLLGSPWRRQIQLWASKGLIFRILSVDTHPSMLKQGHYADRECRGEGGGRKEDLPGNVKIFSSPEETTKSSIPNVEYSGAFSNKGADL